MGIETSSIKTEKQEPYEFRKKLSLVNDDRTSIFGVNYPCSLHLLFISMRINLNIKNIFFQMAYARMPLSAAAVQITTGTAWTSCPIL